MVLQEAVSKQKDVDIFYRTGGEGKTLLLLHGFTSSGAAWDPYLARMGKKYRLVVPDLRGHGRSTNPGGVFTHRQAALDMYTLLDELGIDAFYAMGHSSGGMTLIHMATQQPERICGMALFSATSYFPEQCRAIQRQAKINPEWMETMRKIHAYGDEQIHLLMRNFNEMAECYTDMNFAPPYLSTIAARTLIIHGDRDPFFPVTIPVEMYHSIPNSALWIVPNTEHDTLGSLAGPIGALQDFTERIFDYWDRID